MRIGGASLSDLPHLRSGVKSRRVSGWDRSGGARHWNTFEPGERKVIADIGGAGCIKHIWMAGASQVPYFARRVIIRMWWEDEDQPSVEAPLGDFYGIGHGIIKNFWSLPLQMGPQNGNGFNCWFPMPFASAARVEIHNDMAEEFKLYAIFDYEEYEKLDDDIGRFHVQWRRENPTEGYELGLRQTYQIFGEDGKPRLTEYGDRLWSQKNLDGKGNYVILEARGKGHYVGCHLDVDCFQREKYDWWGDGGDMIWIDEEDSAWPPRLHGCGTEDYFCMAYTPKQEFCTPYYGLSLYNGHEDWPYKWPWKGKQSVYRFHIEDPIYFEKSIKVTIEHGHANMLSHDYSSTAYWYQTEPHVPFPELLPVGGRVPRPD